MKKVPAIVFAFFSFFLLWALPTQAARYRAPSATPTISTISPTTHVAGSFTVRINGTNFTGVQAVAAISTSTGTAGGTTTFVVNYSTRITATVNLPADTYYFKVTTSGGTANSPNLVVSSPPPTISTISPTTHTVGTFGVTITGTNFTSVQAVSAISTSTGTAVGNPTFGVTSPSQIAANVNLSAGTYYLRVATSSGTANSPNLVVSFPAPIPAPTPVPAPPAPNATSYKLKSPLPNIVNDGTVSEGVSTSGYRTMWKDGSNVVHIFAPFGGNNDVNGWKAQYINTNTGVHALVAGPPHGAAMAVNYNPNNDRLYIAASNGYNGESCLSEFSAATHLATTLKTGLNNVIGGLQMGDDKRVYFPAQGPALYSYDPAAGMPNGWKDYGTITNLVDYGTNYISLGVDATYVYMGMPKKADGTWSLWITPISGTPKWTEWQYGNSGDTAIEISREADTGKLYLRRQLADGNTMLAYYLANGTYTPVSPVPDENNDLKKAPLYCASFQDPVMYHVFSDTYAWDFEDTDLYPIKGIHEYTQARYRQTGNQTWIAPQDSYTGPWVAQAIQCVAYHNNTVLAVTGGYESTLNLDYLTPASTYLGSNCFSPYEAMNHWSGEIYIGGYSNHVARYDPTLPWTLTMANSSPRLPSDNTKPNPYFIQMPAPCLHYRHCLAYDANALVWIGGNTTRENPDYGNVMWYNPSDGSTGYMFPGWAATGNMFRNLCASNSRRRICVSDNTGNIWLIDTATKTVDPAPIVPIASTATKTYMIEVADDIVFGIVFAPGPIYKLIRFKPSTKQILTLQDLGVSGSPFGFGDNQYDRMNFKLELGPDGYVWMFIGDSLYRVDPTTCVFAKVMDAPYAKLKFAPNNVDLLLYGREDDMDFKYIPGILEAVSP